MYIYIYIYIYIYRERERERERDVRYITDNPEISSYNSVKKILIKKIFII